MDYKQDVFDWLEVAGHIKGDELRVPLAEGLILEELGEFLDAYKEKDENQTLDGIVDIEWTMGNLAYFAGFKLIPHDENDLEKLMAQSFDPDDLVVFIEMAVKAFVNNPKNEEKQKISKFVSLLIDCLVYSMGLRGKLYLYRRAVSISNWSKFEKDEGQAFLTCVAYGEGLHWDKEGSVIQTDFRKVGDLYVIFNKQTGKILKSLNYLKAEDIYDDGKY
ncbi:MAG: hypothetical protein ACRDBG_14345 [Waterburya sp.]